MNQQWTEKMMRFYNKIKEILKLTGKHNDNIIMGDFNAKILYDKFEEIVDIGTRKRRIDFQNSVKKRTWAFLIHIFIFFLAVSTSGNTDARQKRK